MQKVCHYIDDNYVSAIEFYSELMLSVYAPYALFRALSELDTYNQVFVEGHWFKKKIIYIGGY